MVLSHPSFPPPPPALPSTATTYRPSGRRVARPSAACERPRFQTTSRHSHMRSARDHRVPSHASTASAPPPRLGRTPAPFTMRIYAPHAIFGRGALARCAPAGVGSWRVEAPQPMVRRDAQRWWRWLYKVGRRRHATAFSLGTTGPGGLVPARGKCCRGGGAHAVCAVFGAGRAGFAE